MFSEPTQTTHLKYVKMLCRAFIREKMWEPLTVERHATYFFNCGTYGIDTLPHVALYRWAK